MVLPTELGPVFGLPINALYQLQDPGSQKDNKEKATPKGAQPINSVYNLGTRS